MIRLTTVPDSQSWTAIGQCFGQCRGPRGGRCRTVHVVRPVRLNDRPFSETICTRCGDISFTDAETANVVHCDVTLDDDSPVPRA